MNEIEFTNRYVHVLLKLMLSVPLLLVELNKC